jgi:hypothetical protein
MVIFIIIVCDGSRTILPDDEFFPAPGYPAVTVLRAQYLQAAITIAFEKFSLAIRKNVVPDPAESGPPLIPGRKVTGRHDETPCDTKNHPLPGTSLQGDRFSDGGAPGRYGAENSAVEGVTTPMENPFNFADFCKRSVLIRKKPAYLAA